MLIARALASEPDLLVMDEPLAGVDLRSQEGLADLLSGFGDDGLALLVVLHEQGPMAGVLDRTVTPVRWATRRRRAPQRRRLCARGVARVGRRSDPPVRGAHMIEVLAMPFMQRAIVAALLSGIIAPAIGTFIVQRRMSLLGDGLGHVAIMGVGLAMMTGWAPLPVAVITCVVGAVVVELLRQHGKASGDLGLAILFYGGLASGVLMAGVAGQGAGGLSAFLFGSLTSVSDTDIAVIVVLALVILVLTIGLAPRLFAVSVDEDYSQVLGIKVKTLNLLVVVLAAVTVTISMRTVGLLLISALMVIPVATAQQAFVGFTTSFFGAMAIGAVAALGGTIGSYYLDTATGATIVVTAIALLGLSWLFGRWLRRSERFIPFVEDHGHAHGKAENHDDSHAHSPGVMVIQHGDHLDYIHDGHRHARHGDHYDEH